MIPDLPPFDDRTECDLRDAIPLLPKRMSADQLQRWATRGCRIVANRPKYLFPTLKTGRERITCAAWVDAWTEWVQRVRAEETRRVRDVFERCKAAR
jgi:hypothetical protein